MWTEVVKLIFLTLLTCSNQSIGAECPPKWFDCGNNKCIAEIWHCDGDNDCGNFNDERGCDNPPVEAHCVSSQFSCKSDGHCIPERWHCDGDEDCIDGSDENQCDNVTEECTGFICRNHHCIPDKWRCDGNEDCTDGSDEEFCPQSKLCTESEFLCSSGSCVNQSVVCNGKNDCADGSDEGPHCGDPCENITCSQNCKSTPVGPQCYCNKGYELDEKDNKTCNDIDECKKEGFCSHECTNTVGSYKCTCHDGYELANRTCRASGADPLLVYSTIREVRGVHLRSNRYFLVRRALAQASAVDVDPKSQRIYWVEISNKSTVYTAKTDGSAFRNVLSHGLLIPEDIAVDYVANNLYITDSGLRQILACKNDGTMCHVLHDTNVDKPRSIALDPDGGLMYWSDWGEHSSGIYRSGMDGSRRISLVSNRIGWPNGIALDHASNRLYWADAKLNTIEFITLDGSTRKVLLNSTVFHPYSLTVFEDSIYWSDWKTFSLESCNKFTGHKMTILARENSRRIMGVHVYHPVLIARISNPCWSNDCSHMCLISPVKGFRCACPHGFKLSTDEKTCTKEHGESIFVSEGSSIYYIRPKSVGSDTLTELPLSLGDAMITRVSYDSKSRYMFVADNSKPAIYAINMTSLHTQELVRNFISSPEDLSFDWKSNNLYWIDSAKRTAEIININLLRRVAILTELSPPVALAISSTQGYMFIASLGIHASVAMYDMDGKNRKVLYTVQGMPMSLALHPSKSLLYWTDPRAGTISYVNYTNSRSAQIVKTRIVGVVSIAASEEYIYWTAQKRELNLLKGNVTQVLQLPGQEKGSVSRKVTYSPGVMTAGLSACLIGNGGCSYICVTSPIGRTCACSSDMILSSDNATCIARKCGDNDFKCANGRCLPAEQRCDGSKDCADGSDEVGCSNRCSADDFQCKNGRCILKSWRCDHRDDCGDDSDEQDCPPATACTKEQISCLNGECVSMLWRCDGESDCEDGSDEANCNETRCNSESEIRCDSGQCVPVTWACDGTNDCHDNSDEKNCSMKAKGCSFQEFQCESGACVDQILKCNGRADCDDGSDEKNCPSVNRDCKAGMFKCNDGSCVYDYEVCDGHSDCSHREDESNCTHAVCQPDELLCQSKRCILLQWICDGDADCPDGSDEKNCYEAKTNPPTSSPVSTDCDGFYCYVTGQCLPWFKVCDGFQDCENFPDEGGLCSRSCAFGNGGCSHICKKTPQGSKCFCNKGYSLLSDNKTCGDTDECLEPGTCSHFCNNTRGSFKCSCAEGYVLHNDHHFCKAEGGSATLMYLLGDQIRGLDLSSHSQKVHITMKDTDMRGMDYDAAEGVFYWTELNDGSINSYSTKSRARDVVFRSPSRPVVVKYDWIAGNLYYRDQNSSIGVCTKDGRICKILIHSKLMALDSLAIAPTFGLMFWTIWANPHRNQHSGIIERAEMDGSHRISIVSDKTNAPTAIAVDHVLEMIYWSDRQLSTLECADFHGFKRRQIVKSGVYHPHAVAVFEDNIYWADWGTDSIIRCHKYVKEDCERIHEGNTKAHILLIVHKVMQPKVRSKCLDAHCQQLCLLTRLDPVCVRETSSTENSLTKIAPVDTFSTSSSKQAIQCTEEYCHGDAECIIVDGKQICNCTPPYSGERCDITVAAKVSNYDNHWIIAVILAIVVTSLIILLTLLCIRNREKLQRVGESVTVKFRNPKSSNADRLVMDMDDGSTCEELVLDEEVEYRGCPANSDYIEKNSEESNFKKWPSYGRDSQIIADSIVNFFQRLKRNSNML